MEEIKTHQVNDYIEMMMKNGFSYREIENKLIEKTKLNHIEIKHTLQEVFTKNIKRSIMKYLIASIVLGIIAFVLILYSQQQMSLKTNRYIVNKENEYGHLLQTGQWIGIFSIFLAIMTIFSYLKIKKIKNK